MVYTVSYKNAWFKKFRNILIFPYYRPMECDISFKSLGTAQCVTVFPQMWLNTTLSSLQTSPFTESSQSRKVEIYLIISVHLLTKSFSASTHPCTFLTSVLLTFCTWRCRCVCHEWKKDNFTTLYLQSVQTITAQEWLSTPQYAPILYRSVPQVHLWFSVISAS